MSKITGIPKQNTQDFLEFRFQEIKIKNGVVIAMPRQDQQKSNILENTVGQIDSAKGESSSDDTMSFISSDLEYRIPLIPWYTSMGYEKEEYNLYGLNFEDFDSFRVFHIAQQESMASLLTDDNYNLKGQNFEDFSSLFQVVHQQSIEGSEDSLLTNENYKLHSKNFEEDSSLSQQSIASSEDLFLTDEDYNLNGQNFEEDSSISQVVHQQQSIANSQDLLMTDDDYNCNRNSETEHSVNAQAIPQLNSIADREGRSNVGLVSRCPTTTQTSSSRNDKAAVPITDENVPEVLENLLTSSTFQVQNYK